MASFGLMHQVARLQTEGRVEMVHAAMAKSTGSRMLRDSAARARNMLGGNGTVSSYEAAKIFTDAEIVHTYEGTYEINSLIVARAVTGMSSFVYQRSQHGISRTRSDRDRWGLGAWSQHCQTSCWPRYEGICL